MSINKTLLFLFFIVPNTGFAQDDIIFDKLQYAINDYAIKIDTCNVLRSENDLQVIDIKKIKDIVMQNPSVLSYLSEKTFNNCLQPERGLLAEAILYATTTDEKSQAFVLAESTKKVSFHPNFNDEVIFNRLTTDQQKELLSIDNLKRPFDALELMDRMMGE